METITKNNVQPQQKYTLYEMRKLSGKNGSAVARLVRTSYRTLRNWETGETIPNVVNICDLLEIYGYSFYELDLTPYYENVIEQIKKKEERDEKIDNPNRITRRFEQSE